MNTKNPGYVVGYTVFVAAAFATILVLVNIGVRQGISRNEQVAEMKSVLAAFGMVLPEGASDEEALEFFGARVEPQRIPEAEKGVRPYTVFAGYSSDDKSGSNLLGYAFSINGKGMWGPIYGYMAVEPDLVTVLGITFYKDDETPGLGHEIRKPWFQEAFEGRRYWPAAAAERAGRALREAGSSAAGEKLDSLLESGEVPMPAFEFTPRDQEGEDAYNEVDAITGATVTTGSLDTFLGGNIVRFLKEMAEEGVYPKRWEE